MVDLAKNRHFDDFLKIVILAILAKFGWWIGRLSGLGSMPRPLRGPRRAPVRGTKAPRLGPAPSQDQNSWYGTLFREVPGKFEGFGEVGFPFDP